MRALLATMRRIVALGALQLLCVCASAGAEEIRNAATFTWTSGGATHTIISNSVSVEGPAAPATLALEITASEASASFGDNVDFQLHIRNQSTDRVARDVELAGALPIGFSLVSNSLRIDGARGTSARDATRAGMRVALGEIAPGASLLLSYTLRVGPDAPLGRALNSVTVTTRGSVSVAGEVAVRVEPALGSDGITVLGRVTSGDCAAPTGVVGVRIVLESGAYAITDSSGLYHFEGVRPGLHVVQVDVGGLPSGARLAACRDTTRRAGSDTSQFVEAQGGLLARADFHMSIPAIVAPTATVLAAPEPAADKPEELFAGLQPGIDWLFPVADLNPRAPALRIAIKHGPRDTVQISVNGKPVPAAMFEGVASHASGEIAISQWRGVSIANGDNSLEAVVRSPDGHVTRLTRTIHYANIPARAVLAPESSRLIADGARRPVIAVRILDAAGKPIRAGVTGGVHVSSPYRLAAETEAQQSRQLAGTERFAPTFRVIDDAGLALVELEPTTSPGWAELTFDFPNAAQPDIAQHNAPQRRAEPLRAWLSADREGWIVVGFAAGTAGFSTLAENAEPPIDASDDSLLQDGQASFYAKGRVLGSWLLTMAYDSEKRPDESSLLSVIDPDRYYGLYGDASSVGYDAASSKKLYLRLERDTYYAMFGDFETGFTDTQLTRFSRTLTGLKAESAGGPVNAAIFAARTAQRSLRDEIAGNGLSGPYRLSSTDIIANTDDIRIETRDRMHSDRVIATRALVRHIDYEIDYASASILFRQPVLSKDSTFNPIYIVAEYETYGAAKEELTTGGRITADIAGEAVRIGATAVSDERLGAGRMAGLDLVAHVDGATTIRLEAALSDSGAGSLGGKAGAWMAEIQHTDGDTDLLAYARRQDARFGLGQSPLGQSGSEKFGFDLRHKLGGDLSMTAAASHEEALASRATRDSGEVRLEHHDDDGATFIGARAVREDSDTGGARSNQLLVGASRYLLDRKLEVSEASDVTIGRSAPSNAFPTRHRISAAYAFNDAIRLSATHEMTPEGAQERSATQVGFDVKPWEGARLSSTLSQTAIVERGERTFAQYGLSQSLPIDERWTIDATYDSGRTLKAAAGSEAPAVKTPISTGSHAQKDFDAATAGATYRAETWSWNGRVEYRSAEDEDRIAIISNSINQLNALTSLATSFRARSRTDRRGQDALSAEGRVSAAFRPLDSPWTMLARTTLSYGARDLAAAPAPVTPTATAQDSESTRLVSVLSASFDAGPANPWTASLYYGAKSIFADADAMQTRGNAEILGAAVRHDVGPQLDVGLSAAVRRQGSSGQTRFTAGPSVGWSPQQNFWISVGYNVVGFRDSEFEDNHYTRKGAYVTFRFKFDQSSFGSVLASASSTGELAGSAL